MKKTAILFLAMFAAVFSGCSNSEVPERTLTVATPTADEPVVFLTPAAVSALRGFLKDSPDSYIRVSVSVGGCSGFLYGMNIDDATILAEERVDRSNGFAVVVAAKDALLIEGTTIDWLIEDNGATGFKFNNPNAAKATDG
ncbi:iron-sulfur cluster assembly accessory protein [Mariniblastus sp.]|nr:iron-sulfur cluster assembly accessory protein [Mariniblastus sp.]